MQSALGATGFLIALWATCLCGRGSVQGEEFVGPFASWANAKEHYGAIGDGAADDTAALQRALDDLRREDRPRSVLYLPAGTYRITRTLELRRETHSESQGVAIFGEEPATTVIVWDGLADGVMFFYNAWYASVGRITLDGRGKARTALQHGPAFTTANEFCDMVFRDVSFGIEAGMENGIAETAVERCAFVRCSQAGISIQNWNSLDWWVWDCLFDGCKLGVTNTFGAGNFNVYQSVFRDSTEADISIGNTMFFAMRDNVSVNSKAFFVAGAIGAGAPTVLQRNTIVDPQDASPIRVGNLGTLQLLDNTIRTRTAEGPAVADIGWSGLTAVSVGNRFTTGEHVRAGHRLITIEDQTVDADEVQVEVPSLPRVARKPERELIDVAAGSETAAIQQAVDQAAADPNRRWVIHLPAGRYSIDRTLVIPPGLDVVLVGDAMLNATTLAWQGGDQGPVLRLEGPSRATVRDLLIDAGRSADGVVVEDCDQEGAQVYANQLDLAGNTVGLLVDRVSAAAVDLRNFQHGGCNIGLRVVGTEPGEGEATETPGAGRHTPVVVYCGASSNNELSYEVADGARLVVRDIWYESGQFPTFMRCTESGEFTMQLGNIALGRTAEQPSVLVDGFRGKLAFLGTDFAGQPEELPALVVRGESAQTKLLGVGVHGDGAYYSNQSTGAQAALLAAHRRTPGGGAEPIEDVGEAEPEFLLSMLAQTRGVGPHHWSPASPGVTDVRFHRVFVTNAINGVTLQH